MLTAPLLKTNQSNSTPTEVQVKLAIAQVLSLPSVYNSPVFILDFKIDDKEVVTGRFRDARKPRVFSYEIADDGITFKPFVPGRMDGFDVKFWEDFSAGYSYRIDAVAKKRTEKPKCKEGVSYPCGKSCISLKKNCKTNPQDPVSKARRQKLKNTVEEVQKAKGGVAASGVGGGAGVSKEAEEVAIKVGAKQVNIVGSPDLYKELNLTHDPSLGWQVTNKNGDVLRQPKNGNLQPSHRFKEKSQAENFAKQVMAKVSKLPNSKPQEQAKPTFSKTVDQQYKDIIASSKHPGRTEEALSSALMHGIYDFHKDKYNRYSDAIKSGTVPKGYENHYRENVDTFKPVIEAEDFINERREKAIKGDYETEGEARVYVLNKMKEKGYKEHEYYDSPDYQKDYEKLKGIMKSREVPPPLSGSVPGKDLRKTLIPGDKLFVKNYASDLIRSGNPSEYGIADGGEVLKVNIKNAKVRKKGTSLNGKPYDVEGMATLRDVTHVIRDGKRYKVDPSDSSQNDLGLQVKDKSTAKPAEVKTEKQSTKWNNKNFSPDDYIKEKDSLADEWFKQGNKDAKEKYDQWVQNSLKKKVRLTVPGDVLATPDFVNMQRSGMINKNEIESKVKTGKELETLRTSYTFPSSFGHALQLYESQKPGVRKKIKFEFDGDLPDIPSRNRREKDDFNANLTLAQFNSDRRNKNNIKSI